MNSDTEGDEGEMRAQRREVGESPLNTRKARKGARRAVFLNFRSGGVNPPGASERAARKGLHALPTGLPQGVLALPAAGVWA